jgi:hypothetical protein
LADKDKPEIIWPTAGRRIAGIVSLIGMVSSFGALIIAVRYQTGFISYLSLEFLFFLFLFHAGYAYAQRLTQRQVRKIDYWYLGAAAIGMFLFALNYTDQREAYLGKANVFAFRVQEAKLIQEANVELDKYVAISCGDVVVRASKTQCGIAKGFADKLKPGLTTPELLEVEQSFRQQLIKSYSAVKQEYKRSYPEDSDPAEPYFGQAAWFQVRLENLKNAVAAAPNTARAKTMNEEVEVLIGLGQTIVWPFLLAFALALRLSKVTVDVFGWAE